MENSNDDFLDKLFQSLSNKPYNTLSLIFVLIGGLIFLGYYIKLGYLPDIDWQSILIYIFIAALIGGGVFLVFSFLIYVPARLWSRLATCEQLWEHFCKKASAEEGSEPSERQILVDKLLWSLAVPTFGVLLFLTIGNQMYHLTEKAEWNWMAAVSLGIAVVVLVWKIVHIYTVKLPASIREGQKNDFDLGPRSVYLIWYLASILSSTLAILLLIHLIGWEDGREFQVILASSIATLAVVSGMSLVAHQYKYNPREALLYTILFSAAVIVIANYSNPKRQLPEMVLTSCGFSGQMVKLGFKDDNCLVGKELGIEKNCEDDRTMLDRVQILCPMGRNYLLNFEGKVFSLEKSRVLYIGYFKE